MAYIPIQAGIRLRLLSFLTSRFLKTVKILCRYFVKIIFYPIDGRTWACVTFGPPVRVPLQESVEIHVAHDDDDVGYPQEELVHRHQLTVQKILEP